MLRVWTIFYAKISFARLQKFSSHQTSALIQLFRRTLDMVADGNIAVTQYEGLFRSIIAEHCPIGESKSVQLNQGSNENASTKSSPPKKGPPATTASSPATFSIASLASVVDYASSTFAEFYYTYWPYCAFRVLQHSRLYTAFLRNPVGECSVDQALLYHVPVPFHEITVNVPLPFSSVPPVALAEGKESRSQDLLNKLQAKHAPATGKIAQSMFNLHEQQLERNSETAPEYVGERHAPILDNTEAHTNAPLTTTINILVSELPPLKEGMALDRYEAYLARKNMQQMKKVSE